MNADGLTTKKVLLALLLAACLGSGPLFAAATWTGGGADGSWGDVDNWGGTAIDVTATGVLDDGDLVFANNHASGLTIALDKSYGGLTSISFAGADGAYTIDDGTDYTLTCGAAATITNPVNFNQTIDVAITAGATSLTLTNSGSNALIIGDPIDLSAGGALIVDGASGTTTLNDVVSGSGALQKSGAGALCLVGNNTFSGGTSIAAGTVTIIGSVSSDVTMTGGVLVLGAEGALGSATSLAINDDAAIQSNDDARTFAQGITIADTKTLTVSGPNSLAIDGSITDGANTGNLTVNLDAAAKTLSLSGANDFSGVVTVTRGRLQLNGGAAIDDGAEIALSGGANAALLLGTQETIGDFSGTAGSTVNLGAYELRATGAGTKTFAGTLTSTAEGEFTYAGSGQLTLSGDSAATHLGDTEVSGTGTLIISGAVGGELDIMSGEARLTAASAVAGNVEIEGGTLAVADPDAIDGAITIAGGTLAASGGDVVLDTGNAITVNNNFALSGSDQLTLADGITLGADVTVTVTDTHVLAGIIDDGANTRNLTKAGAGTLVLGGVNTYNGVTTVNDGTLRIDAAGSIAGALMVSGSGIVDVDGVVTGNATINTSATTNNIAAGGVLGSLSHEAGTTTLAGAAAVGGSASLSGGVLIFGDNAAVTGDLAVSGGKLQAGGGAKTLANDLAVTGSFAIGNGDNLTLTGDIDLGGATRTITIDDADTLALSGAIGNGGLTLVAASGGTFELSGTNTYTGATSLQSGTLNLVGGAAIADSGALDIDGGTVDLGADDETVGSLSGAGGTLDVSGQTLTVNQSSSATFAGVLADSGGGGVLTKAGAGTLTLSGDSTVGTVNINAGTLALGAPNETTNVITGNVNVTGTLTGVGQITGNVVAVAGGRIAPGNSVGKISIDGNFTLPANTTLAVELASTSSTDQILTTGDIDLTDGTIAVSPAASGCAMVSDGDTFVIGAHDESGGAITLTNTTVNSNFATVTFAATAEDLGGAGGNDESLVLTASRPAAAFQGVATTTAAKTVGAALDEVCGGALDADAQSLIARMDAVPAAQMDEAMEELAGQSAAAVSSIATQATQAFSAAQSSYLAAKRQGLPVFAYDFTTDDRASYTLGHAGMSVQTTAAMLAAEQQRQEEAEDVDGLVLASNAERWDDRFETPGGPWGAYVKIFGFTNDWDATTNRTGYRTNAVGTQGGVDYQLDENWLVGMCLGYTYSDVDYKDGLGTGSQHNVRVGPYCSYQQDKYYVDGALTYGYHSINQNRGMPMLGLTGESTRDGHDMSLYVGGGYHLDHEKWRFTPNGSLQYVYYTEDGYTETISGAPNQAVNSFDTHSLKTTIGLTVSRIFDYADVRIKPEIYVAWGHEFMDNDVPTRTFVGGTTGFSPTVPAPDRDSIEFGAGATTMVDGATAVFLRYDGKVFSSGQIHAVTLGVKLLF